MSQKENNRHRYHSFNIVLHWLMAIGFLFMLASGIIAEFGGLEKPLRFNVFQWHKSTGVLLLLCLVARIITRLAYKAPDLPAIFSSFEIKAAKLGHLTLYAAMILMLGSGWVIVSSSSYGLPTIVFGWFEWPHIPDIQGDKTIRSIGGGIHFYVAWIFIALITGHIAMVVKHKLSHHVNLMKRMWW